MNRKTNEKIVSGFIAFSLLIFVAGFIGACFAAYYNNSELNTFISYCGLLCFVPFISLQFFLSAGIYVRFFSDAYPVVKVLLYLFAFPFANLWFVGWLDAYAHFLSTSGSSEAMAKLLITYATVLWLLLNLSGLIVRLIRLRKKVLA
jgi:hypothetical protein